MEDWFMVTCQTCTVQTTVYIAE